MTTYNLGTVVGTNGTDGRGIRCIQKTDTTGNTDTYTIYYTDETTSTFEVTNGEGADIVTAWESTPSDTKIPSEKLVKNTLDTKQASLVSGTNIKTINNNSLLGSGNIDIQGGSIDIVTSWETTLSDTKVPSEKLTKNTIDTKVDKVTGKGLSTEDYTSSEKTKLAGIETGANNYTHPTAKQCNYAPDLSNYIQKSSSTGLIKNDGTVMSSGSGSSNYAAGNHTHTGYVSATKVTSWSGTVSDNNIPSEKLVKDSLDNKISTSSTTGLVKNDGTVMTSGTGSSNWAVGNHTHSGYVSASKVTSWSGTVSDSNVPSEKLVKDTLDTKISTSNTSGLVKNDGSIDTNTYLTTGSASSTYVAKSDIVDNLTTNDGTKVLSAKQGKALKDLIGDAIDYINL